MSTDAPVPSFHERRKRAEREEVARLLASPEADEAYRKLCNAFAEFGRAILPAVEAAPEENYRRAHARSVAVMLMSEAEGEAWKLIAPDGKS